MYGCDKLSQVIILCLTVIPLGNSLVITQSSVVERDTHNMLANFTITRTFHKLRATIIVDCVRKEANVTLTYDRRLRECRDIPYHEVSMPDTAEAWLSKPYSEYGNLIESLENQYRHKWGIVA